MKPHQDSALGELSRELTTIAVTGTNGKTSTTSMIASIVEAAGQPAVRVTTLGMWVGAEQTADDGSMASFVRTLRRARECGARTLALEVTSRALAAGFAERWPAQIGVFTNLTADHLDRHQTPERYLAAKAQLFVHLRPPAIAVLNAADPASALLAEALAGRAQLRGFGRALQPASVSSALLARAVALDERGVRVELEPSPLATALGDALALQVLGEFQADNALAAAVAADAAGIAHRAIRAGLEAFRGVAGRFEVVARQPLAVVDYAHTPDALRRALRSARTLARERGGRVACVFGCGGERDVHKRAPMGEVADQLADAVWLTTDNPRSESPEAIAAMVFAGARGGACWQAEPDRRRAILAAVAWAQAADVVVVAGRGHERWQQLGSGAVELSDRQVLARALRQADAGGA